MGQFGVALRVWGPLACFTRPEMKAERVSYDVITPSAARGIVEAIYWKPQIRWVIDRIHVMSPVRFLSIRRNELGSKIPERTALTAMRAGSGALGIVVEDDRQQRASIMLRDVNYIIEAHFELRTPEDTDNPRPEAKHLDQFNRRARAGQCFQRPYLGCRELVADFELVESPVPPSPLAGTPEGDRDLGYMLHDIEFTPDPDGSVIEGSRGLRVTPTARFFRAVMRSGVIDVPPLDHPEVRA
ncbi:MAG: type I-C CRISPR-associated protein Cas5c [Phycisphaerales bacterium]|jgi:CRISPR-associated protein Cas5d|nr:type I-C CRISPR-associated protein Cas5c [Phycisphaerales bacterium]